MKSRASEILYNNEKISPFVQRIELALQSGEWDRAHHVIEDAQEQLNEIALNVRNVWGASLKELGICSVSESRLSEAGIGYIQQLLATTPNKLLSISHFGLARLIHVAGCVVKVKHLLLHEHNQSYFERIDEPWNQILQSEDHAHLLRSWFSFHKRDIDRLELSIVHLNISRTILEKLEEMMVLNVGDILIRDPRWFLRADQGGIFTIEKVRAKERNMSQEPVGLEHEELESIHRALAAMFPRLSSDQRNSGGKIHRLWSVGIRRGGGRGG